MAGKRALREEIRDVHRERDYVLRCKITDHQYQILECVRTRNVEKFKQLLNMGIDPGFTTDKGETSLHIVSGMKPDEASLEILSLLVYFGTSLNTMDRFGQTPLHHAARISAQNVKILLEGGANSDLMDNSGRTALMEACNSSPQDALTVVQYLMDRGCNIYSTDQDGCSALHYICMNKSQLVSIKTEIVYKLLYAGLSATATDKTGKMAICYDFQQYLCRRSNSSSPIKLVDDRLKVTIALIQGGANYNRKNQQHSKSIKDAVALYNSPSLTSLLMEFRPVLSVSSLKSIRENVLTGEGQCELLRHLTDLTHKVQSLKFMCRINIRDTLKGKCLPKIDLLPLPRTLKEYLSLIE
ncbi:uncharacterized protein LOC143063855 [Mytilus galloprovincialis]|uniref:uncharacterized protein LOC143063855 n=1 Tax=Mytilus galloprovincialis TaxID=29158 RepID=UPI003F7CB5EB